MIDFAAIIGYHFSLDEFTQGTNEVGAILQEYGRFFILGQDGFIYVGLDESVLKNSVKIKSS